VSIDAGNRVSSYNPAPFGVNRRGVERQEKKQFSLFDLTPNAFNREAKTVMRDRPRGNNPELINNLRDDVNGFFSAQEGLDARPRLLVHRMARLSDSQEDVGVQQIRH
jgi:hypothetical protein